MASKYDLNIDQGASFYRKLTWKNPDNSSIDTTGYTSKMQIRTRIGGTIMQELTTANNEIIISTNGIIEIKLSAIQSMAITNNGVYDLDLISPLGNVIRLLQGNVILSQTVTI